MSVNDNKSVIEQLEYVQALLHEASAKNAFLAYGSDNIFAEQSAKLKSELGQLKQPSVFSHFPVLPLDSSYCDAVEKDKASKGRLLKLSLIGAVSFLALFFITHWGILNTLAVISIVATIIFGFMYKSSKEVYQKKKVVYDESVNKYNESNRKFLAALEVFEEEKEACVIAAKDYSEKYHAAYNGFLSMFMEKVDQETEAAERIDAIKMELANNSIVVPEYYHLLNNVISNLKSGRADDYKEALNLAISEDKEDKERQARLEQEEYRNRILAQQAAEEKRHNEQLEKQQREHEAAVLLEQQRQHKEQMNLQKKQAEEAKRQAEKAASEARKQANATKSAGISKCASCANSKHCPSHIKNNGSGLTCGGYVPYGANK